MPCEALTLPLCHSLLIDMIVFSTWYTSVPLLGSIKSAFLLSTYEAKSILQVHWLRFFLLPCWSKMGESGKIWLVYFRYEMKCSFYLEALVLSVIFCGIPSFLAKSLYFLNIEVTES